MHRKKEFTIFEMPLDGISNGAHVQWVSQYPEEEEVIIPPYTYLSRTKVSMLTKNISHITVRADISTARPYIGNIKTTTDKDTHYFVDTNDSQKVNGKTFSF